MIAMTWGVVEDAEERGLDAERAAWITGSETHRRDAARSRAWAGWLAAIADAAVRIEGRPRTEHELRAIRDAIAPGGRLEVDGMAWSISVAEAGGRPGWIRITGRVGLMREWQRVHGYGQHETPEEIGARMHRWVAAAIEDEHDLLVEHAAAIAAARASR